MVFPNPDVRVGADDRRARRPHARGMNAAEPLLCKLQYAAGRVEECPRDVCPFWEPGGAVLAGRCAVERLDLAARPDVAHWLLCIRKRLEGAATAGEADETRRLFYRLLNTGDADGG